MIYVMGGPGSMVTKDLCITRFCPVKVVKLGARGGSETHSGIDMGENGKE